MGGPTKALLQDCLGPLAHGSFASGLPGALASCQPLEGSILIVPGGCRHQQTLLAMYWRLLALLAAPCVLLAPPEHADWVSCRSSSWAVADSLASCTPWWMRLCPGVAPATLWAMRSYRQAYCPVIGS